jgi:hypothetical protein
MLLTFIVLASYVVIVSFVAGILASLVRYWIPLLLVLSVSVGVALAEMSTGPTDFVLGIVLSSVVFLLGESLGRRINLTRTQPRT